MDTTSATALLPPQATSARRARRFLGATLEDWACADAVEVVTLLTSELVTNALLHAVSGVHVEMRRAADLIRVEVHDESSLAPVVRHYSDEAETGRGMALVELLAATWGVSPCRHGKAVWFEVPIGGARKE